MKEQDRVVAVDDCLDDLTPDESVRQSRPVFDNLVLMRPCTNPDH
jgi:hypothetical protein